MDKNHVCGNENPCSDDVAEEDVPLDVDGGELGDGLSGFLIVRLSREVDLTDHRELRGLAEEMKLDALAELLDELGRPPTRRLVTSVEPRELLRMEQEVSTSRWRPLNSLTHYWRIDMRRLPQGLEELARRFTAPAAPPRLNGAEMPASAP